MRFLDLMASIFGLIVLSPLMVLLYFLGLFDTGSPIFSQERLGKHKRRFIVYKFRTMPVGTASAPTHEVGETSVTKLGSFLRKSKLDELPQLVNVLIGDMSLVGPRPSLTTQIDLIEARDKFDVYSVRPGITGLSQIRRIDMSTPLELAKTDRQMIDTLNVYNYFKYVFLTITGSGGGDRVKSEK